jgi:hypothetical protein
MKIIDVLEEVTQAQRIVRTWVRAGLHLHAIMTAMALEGRNA